MRKYYFLTCLLLAVLSFSSRAALSQNYFRVISGVPHLPVLEPESIASPSVGMLIYSAAQGSPLVYTGSSWERLCSSNPVSASSVTTSFAVEEGIPYLPVLSNNPTGNIEAGSVYFSPAEGLKVHTGVGWLRLSGLKGYNTGLAQSNGFSANGSLKLSRLPVLGGNPAPIGLSAGAIYINAPTKAIRYYDGSTWQEVGCAPVVSTLDITGVTNTEAVSGALLHSEGGSTVTMHGIIWSTSNNPLPDTTLSTKTRHVVTDPVSLPAPFQSVLSNLTGSTTYYVRAYAVNSAGIAYGEVKTFKTAVASVPTIITLPATELTPISVRSGGNIPSTGGAAVTERGILWSTTGDPLIDSVAKIVDTAAIRTSDGSGPGLFPTRLTNLTEGTTYYVRAYARNIIGTAYGNLVIFSTLAPTPPVLSAPTIHIFAITDTSAKSEVTILNNGGAEVEERGVAWSTERIASWSYGNGQIIHHPSSTVNPTDIGTFACELINLEPGTLYYVRPYARNRIGIRYGAETSFRTTSLPTLRTLAVSSIRGMQAVGGGEVMSPGASKVTERGIVWSSDPAFDPETVPAGNKVSQSVVSYQSGVGAYFSNIAGLQPSTRYYVRAFATNSLGTAYGDTVSFTTAALPTVVTHPQVAEIASVSANSGGVVTDDGGEWVYARGVVWSASPQPTLATGTVIYSGTGTGSYVSSLTGLMANSTYYVRAYATNAVGTVYGNEIEFTTAAPVPATVTTGSVTDIGDIYAMGHGSISSHGGDTVTWRGICWNTAGMPTVSDSYAQSPVSGLGTGAFSAAITGLAANRTYYVRAFARTSAGIVYGQQVVFATFTIPTLVTSQPDSITSSSASAGGRIISDGGDKVSSSGLVWSTDPLPTLQNMVSRTTGGPGIGEFIHGIAGLWGNTTYYVRAYAINRAGTAYGEVFTFKTAPPVPPSITTRIVGGITGTEALGGGDVSDHGGAQLVRTGLVWSTTSGFDPSTVPGTNRTLQADRGSFSSMMTGLEPGTTYYVRAYAENSAGIAYAGNEVRFTTLRLATVETKAVVDQVTGTSARSGGVISSNGGTHVSQNGVVWAMHPNPTLSDYVSTPTGSGIGTFSAELKDLWGNTDYWVRAYATNKAGTAYGQAVAFRTGPPVAPTVTTRLPAVTSAATAEGGGEITSNGGARVTTRGVVWSTTQGFNPAAVPQGQRTAQAGYTTGSFISELSGLEAGETYYVRAYAENEAGFRAYGEEVSFRMPLPPGLTTRAVFPIGHRTATGGGIVHDDGGARIETSGVIWSTGSDFTPTLSSPNKTVQAGGSTFSSQLTGLVPETTYYVRAYATNIAGTSFGNQVSFTTSLAGLATIETIVPRDITGNSALSGGVISDDGGVQVSTRGVVWSLIPDFNPNTDPIVGQTEQTGSSTGRFISTLAGLEKGKTYYVRAYVDNAVGRTYGEALMFQTQDIPVLGPLVIMDTTAFTALGQAGITSDGRASLISHGLVWSTSPGPHTGLSTKTSHSGGAIGTFTSTLAGLSPITTYYVRAYAVNTVGQAYSNEVRFTTRPTVPTVSSAAVLPTSGTSARGGGEVTDDGGAAVITRGIVWSTNPNFNPDTVTVNRTADGAGTGTFTSALQNLEERITYYIRAYATNEAGTGYGDIVTFSMLATSPELTTSKAFTGITGTTATGGGEVTRDGGSPVHTWGLVWSTTDANPVIESHPHTTIRGNSTLGFVGEFTSQMANLAPNTQYYVRAYAINGVGTAYGLAETVETATVPTLTATGPITELRTTSAVVQCEVTDDGRMPILARGFVWSIYDDLKTVGSNRVEEIVSGSTGTGVFSATLTRLESEKTYYVWAYARNEVGTTYATRLETKTLPVMEPTVTTGPAVAVEGTSAEAGGEVTDDGGSTVTARGMVWSTDRNPQLSQPGSGFVASDSGIGVFSGLMTSLQPKTTYYFRAFATNAKGTGYGKLDSLITPAMAPTVSLVTMVNLQMTFVEVSAGVTADGGEPVEERGFVWNTTGITPDLAADDTLRLWGTGPGVAGTLENLSSSTTYYVWAYARNTVGTGFSVNPTVFTTPTLPAVTTTAPVAAATITLNSAKVSGNVTQDGGAAISARGIVWSTDSAFNPVQARLDTISTKAEEPILSGAGTGSFTRELTGLAQGTTYYVWAYATNSVGTGYGSRVVFRTLDIPVLTTVAPAYDSLNNSAVSGGHITWDGGKPVTARGIVWSTTDRSPTIALPTKTSNGSGTGSFTATLPGLLPGTTYYVRAYATNSVGTGYGGVDSLTAPALLPTLTKVTVSEMQEPTAKGTAEIISDGGAQIEAQGIVWNTTGEAPDLSRDNSVQADVATGTGTFSAIMNGLTEGPTYYVWAYASNSAGTAFGPVESFIFCPSEFPALHVAGHSGAPVTKEVTYRVVSSNLTGEAKCWITQNLGADRQATAVNDNSEAAAGWYWQFNRSQGYKHDGTTRTPNTAWLGISESSDWTAANDPCQLLLGGGWRLPTTAEWTAVDAAPQNWGNYGHAYASELKLHAAGYLNYSNGTLGNRGVQGIYWGSTQNGATTALSLDIASGKSALVNAYKSWGYTLRCLRGTAVKTAPSVSGVTVSNMTESSATLSAAVTPDGGAPVTARGFVWNTTGNPTLADNVITDAASGMGAFSGTMNGLEEGPTYYVRAWATNSQGTSFGEVVSFKLCPQVTVLHVAGHNGAPVTKEVTYETVSSNMTGQSFCWLTQNLGADRQATAVNDNSEAAAGWYWQFNRSQGYKHDGTTRTPNTAWLGISESSDWVAENDPCQLLLGGGWRLPTKAEWTAADASQNWSNYNHAYTSALKLHASGTLYGGSLYNRSGAGDFWSSTKVNNTEGSFFRIGSTQSGLLVAAKSYGFAVRCLADAAVKTAPSVSGVTVSEMTESSATLSAAVTPDGGAPVTARGFVWNTTGNPTLADNVITDAASGMGAFSGTMNGLEEGPTYYVRAWATNSQGTAYGEVASFMLCPAELTVLHVAGQNGAPVTKEVTYKTINANLTGEAKCWITQNLGADRQALSATDNTEEAAGWYFQFNRSQGYKHDGTTRTPNTSWNANIVENSDWIAANDPCSLLLGGDWRLPTDLEWTAADASQNWSNYNHTFSSVLKLHAAGVLSYTDGKLSARGAQGVYWSSVQNSADVGRALVISSSGSAMSRGYKRWGYTVRCLSKTSY